MDENATSDRATTLLFRLPPELRLNIYELCLPFMWHHRRRVRADYLSDSAWMATSPAIFADAAPLVLRKPVICMHTNLKTERTVIQDFEGSLRTSNLKEHAWVAPLARSMVTKLAITIRHPHCRFLNIGEQVDRYLSNLSAFTSLKGLHVSLAPEFLPQSNFDWGWYSHGGSSAIASQEKYGGHVGNSAERGVLHDVVGAVRGHLPRGCAVKWRLDRSAMPALSCVLSERAEAIRILTQMNDTLGRLWEVSDRVAVEEHVRQTTIS